MKRAVLSGMGFGLTSGVITTIGLMVGLFSAIQSKMVIIGGIVSVAIANSSSDALGMHISKEAENMHSKKQKLSATASTLLSELILTLSFIIPILLFDLKTAIIISIVYGMLVLTILSFNIANKNKENPLSVIFEHLILAIAIVIITYYVGKFVSLYFS